MKIFRKKKGNGAGIRPLLLRSVYTGYKKTQTGWVRLMEHCTKNFSRRTWIIALVIYALAAIGLCTYLILSSIR